MTRLVIFQTLVEVLVSLQFTKYVLYTTKAMLEKSYGIVVDFKRIAKIFLANALSNCSSFNTDEVETAKNFPYI